MKKSKTDVTSVGEYCIRAHSKEFTKNNKGITLIALIITIIVMLILVGVTVTVALNGGLFKTAKETAEATNTEKDKEQTLAKGQVEIDGKKYASMEDYLNNKELIEWIETEIPDEWKNEDGTVNEKVKAMKFGEDTIPLPEGFEISIKEGEQTISEGLVITDGANEFVWIPCADEYTEDDLGPLTGTDNTSTFVLDSQEELNYYYGTDENGNPYYNYSDFDYATDKTNIETSINKYDGFYVGRYETTIDSNGTIGSMVNTEVLTAAHALRDGTNTNSNEKYYYRWWGLYKVQKDMYAQDEAVFSTMITNKQWNIIIDFTEYNDGTREVDTYTNTDTPDLSGSTYKGTTDTYDVSKNIYDLAGNITELTYSSVGGSFRIERGRCFWL